jgi:hypothetical protein
MARLTENSPGRKPGTRGSQRTSGTTKPRQQKICVNAHSDIVLLYYIISQPPAGRKEIILPESPKMSENWQAGQELAILPFSAETGTKALPQKVALAIIS